MIVVDPEIEKLIPDDLIREAEKAGIKKISSAHLQDGVETVFAVFRPTVMEIVLDLTKGEKLLALYRMRNCELHLTASEAYPLLFFHELSHLKFKDERDCHEHAVRLFREWRDATRKKIVEEVEKGVREGFKAWFKCEFL